MDCKIMTPLEQVEYSIENNQHFVLQGGAGSGKTETLKQVLAFISDRFPNKKVACITHTNLAADEIASRVDGDYCISTIHSFLNTLIKDYKKNIHQVIYELFKLETVQRLDLNNFDDEKALKKTEHDNYKKQYEKYAKQLFTLKKSSIEKVVGKKEYDKTPARYNEILNDNINKLNLIIQECIDEKDYNQAGYNEYNETSFDNLKNITYGHDGLLTIASLLCSRFPLIARILQDKFDYIFIDEFQDTHPDIIDIFLNKLPNDSKTTIGLFGDSMQGIYDDGIGDVACYIDNKRLVKIPKLDNYRCSEQVVNFLNHHRVPIDKLKQELAFKTINGKSECIDDRQGFAKVYYSIYPNSRPHTFSKFEAKEAYTQALMCLIQNIELENPEFKKLMLTNKAIAAKLDFDNLYQVFNDRYSEVNNEIESCLEKLQLLELAQLCIAYKAGDYNFVIMKLKKSAFKINSIADKQKIKKQFDFLLSDGLSAIDAIAKAIEDKIVARSESYNWYLKNRNKFLSELEVDDEFKLFKQIYQLEGNTFNRFRKVAPKFFDENEEHTGQEALYIALERRLKKEQFYKDFFSKKISFKEIVQFDNYLNEKTDYITMHKTKGSGIDNVLVVLDDFFWSKYQFKTLFETPCDKSAMKLKMQKLFYVACSRAKNNLICARLITEDEEEAFKQYFPPEVIVTKIEL